MMDNKIHQCLYCYQELAETDEDYHTNCSKKFFGTATPTLFPYDLAELKKLAIEGSFSRSNDEFGVETKFSLELERKATNELSNYFSISSLNGHFVLKAPITQSPFVPELQDLTLHLARLAQIKTVEHGLIRLASGELAHIYQRIDRTKKGMLQLEDMCQLNGTLTEDKYQGSIERIGKLIHTYSSNPGFDVISLFELTIFCFLTGCGDMHLKNFALLSGNDSDINLSPAFELIPTLLLSTEKKNDLALSVNGKKKNLNKSDFDSLAEKLSINLKTVDNTYKRFQKNLPKLLAFIDISVLEAKMKQRYKSFIKQRAQTILDIDIEEEIEELINELPEEIPTQIDKIENEKLDLVEETPAKPAEKKSLDINTNTGEITEPANDPNRRQLNLFE